MINKLKIKQLLYVGVLSGMMFAMADNVKVAAEITSSWNAETGTLTLSGSGDMAKYEYGKQPWYSYKDSMKKVVVEEGVTSISEAAFYQFSYITEIEIAGTVKTIDMAAFADCTELSKVTLNEGVETINTYAFQSSALTEISLPSTITKMDAPLVFISNTNLATISISPNNTNYCVVDNVIYNKSQTELLFYPLGKTNTNFTIPSMVTTLGANSMRNNSYLEKVVIPSSVTTIEDWCFYNSTGLKSITIPDSVTDVGNGICQNCTGLKTAQLGKGLTRTNYLMFSGCTALQSVVLSEGIEELDLRTFYNCTALTNINLPVGLKSILVYAFYNCTSLGEITLPNTVEYIQAGAFENCSKINLKVPEGMKKLDNGDYAIAYSINVSGTYDYTKAYEVLTIVNAERIMAGFKPLEMDSDLLEAAMKRSAEIAFYFDHTRPNGSSCFDICNKAYGENIAAGNGTSVSVMNSWMNSAGHKANILSSDYTSIGVGCFVIDGSYYWVQLFGIDKAVAPTSKLNEVNVTENIEITKDMAKFELVEKLPNSLPIGKTYTFSFKANNKGWSSKYCYIDANSFDYVSSNKNVATVDSNGVVTSRGQGSCTITVKYKNTSDILLTWNLANVEKKGKENTTTVTSVKKPKKATISKIKKMGKNKVKLTIKKIKKVAGYQVKYSTSKKFKKAKTKTKNIKKNTITIKKLKKSKKYYFKVRAYRINAKGKKIYGKYSKVKRIKL